MHKLTVLVPTYNRENYLRVCLDSVKWADEILICDSYSTDRTLEIAREYTDRIIQHEYINSATQKNWAIPQASYEWVLVIDSDEILESALQDEIRRVLQQHVIEFDGFRIPRKNLIFGKWERTSFLYPDYNLRLFRRDLGQYQDKEVHADVIVPGNVGTLNNSFIHFDEDDIEEMMQKWSRYIRWEGNQMHKTGRRYHWYNVVLRPLLLFFIIYFFDGAYKSGFRGFYTAVTWSFYTFLKHARIWQLEWEESEAGQAYWRNHIYEIE